MKILSFKIHEQFYRFAALIFILMFLGCRSADSFLSPDLSTLFGDGQKNVKDSFRHYSNKGKDQSPLVIYIIDNQDLVSISLEREVEKTCEYTKIPFSSIEIKQWNELKEIPESTRVLCIKNTQKLDNKSIKKICEFVAGGGTLFLPMAYKDERLAFLLGFIPEAQYYTDIQSKGFHLLVPYLPGLAGVDLWANQIHYGFAMQNFSNHINIMANATSNTKFPVILTNQVGAGHIILVNSQYEFTKEDRGFCFAAILTGLEGIPYPIANTSTIFLDDFPCPLFDIKAEPIESEMNLTSADFVKDIWWPDMKRLAKKYNIQYSSMLIFDYKNRVEPPFMFDQWNDHRIKYNGENISLSDYLVNDVIKNGHELAFHGYNHVEYYGNLWSNQDFIELAFNSVKKKWESGNYGKLPISYVPPSDLIDKRGIDKLKTEMPSLKYLCSTFNGLTRDGQNREFDLDPYNKEFFDFPRITSGFNLTLEDRFSQASCYLYTGIWNHFVHPDDVYQTTSAEKHQRKNYELRNYANLGWHKTNGQKRGLYTEFDQYLEKFTTNFPLSRFISAGSAAQIVLDWRASAFQHSSINGLYTVSEINPEESLSDKQYWFVYASYSNLKKIESGFKDQVVRFSKTPFLEGYLYCVYTNKSKLTLPDLSYKKTVNSVTYQQTIQKVKSDNESYDLKVQQFLREYNSKGEDYDEKLKLEIITLKQRMLSETKIDSTVWNRYSKYMIWDDKGAEVWDMLEAHCQQYPMPENILYSKELSKTNDYPNEKLQEKWMYSQIVSDSTDVSTLKSYIDLFDYPENKDKIMFAYQNLIKVDTSFGTYLQYLQFLLSNEPKLAMSELEKITPDIKYKDLATDICWLYVDNYQYQEAYDWSEFSTEIDFKTKMSWLIDMKSYTVLEYQYQKYITQNDKDYQAKATMCEYYHMVGRFSEAWVLANSLPDGSEKENLKKNMNQDVKYIDNKDQLRLLNKYPDFFYPTVKKDLIKTNRLENGDFVSYNNNLESNRKNLSAFKNVFSYNYFNQKGYLNSFGFTYSTMYALKYPVDDPDNVTHKVYGLQYQITSPKDDDKWKYWSRIRGEYSDQNKYYLHLGVGANYSKNKQFTNIELKAFPMENGPSYSKDIYRIQSNLYRDGYFFNKINASLSFEGNFYTKSKGNPLFATNNSFEGTFTGKTILDDGKEKRSKLLPLIELSYLKSSIGETTLNLSSGYPYWIIKERFYSGGGLGWKYHNKDFTSFVEASWFYDTYSDNFKRFIGNTTYQLFDYTALTANFEMYLQSKYYSNVIQFGIKYNLKQKSRKWK